MSLEARLSRIEKVEGELLRKGASLMKSGTSVSVMSLYALGAINRTMSQSKGFRALILARNFPCATILLRTQIDTAMRINGLRFLPDPHQGVRDILEGKIILRQMKSITGEKMTDAFLKSKLAEDHPWITKVYEETSDFVHLSFRHLWPSIRSSNDNERTVMFEISGEDASRSDTDYYEVCETFFEISRLTSVLILGLMMAHLGLAE